MSVSVRFLFVLCVPRKQIWPYLVLFEGKIISSSPYFYFYFSYIKHMGVLFPFSHFEEEVMRVLNIAPSCQAFNSWNFVREFEIVCRGLEIPPSVDVLFLFYATRHSGKWGWVTLGMLLQKVMFKPYSNHYKKWKDMFTRVKG